MLNVKDLRKKTAKELVEQLSSLKKELRETSIAVLQGKEKNVRKPRKLRFDLARMLTVLKEKEILEENEGE